MNKRRARDKEKTVQDILVSAKRLFSEKGLYGTSIRDIEETSGVSKGLILHHFGTKENLYAAVQDVLTQEYVALMAKQRQADGDLQESIRSSIRSSLKHIKQNREYRRLSLWAYLEGQERTSELEQLFTTALIGAMKAGQEAGIVREDVDAFFFPLIIRGTIEYWIRKEKLIQSLYTNDNNQTEDLEEHLINTLLKLCVK